MSSSTPEEVEAQISADEELARRLQAEQNRVDSSTPLIHSIWGGVRTSSGSMNDSDRLPDHAPLPINDEPRRGGQLGAGRGMIRAGGLETEVPAARRNVRMNVMDDGVRGMNASRLGLMLLTMVNIPLVAAGIIVLTLHWKDDEICEETHRMKWRWWALLSVVRLALLTPVVIVRWKLEGQREDQRNQAVDQLSSNIRNSLDIVGLVWFVIGHLWLLQNEHCNNPSESPIYQLCLVYIIIMYIQICLPCILLMLLVPVICFCLPCVIRILGMLQGQQHMKGARKEEIEKLPTVKYGEMEHTEDESCAICLIDYSQEDDLRKLPCNHAFHKPCVDSWLLVNASCPNCRRRCFDTLDDNDEENEGNNNGEEKTAEPVAMAMVGETLV